MTHRQRIHVASEIRERVLASYRKGWRNRLRWALSWRWRRLAEWDAQMQVEQALTFMCRVEPVRRVGDPAVKSTKTMHISYDSEA